MKFRCLTSMVGTPIASLARPSAAILRVSQAWSDDSHLRVHMAGDASTVEIPSAGLWNHETKYRPHAEAQLHQLKQLVLHWQHIRVRP